MRVILNVSETANKELYEALEAVPSRERAARVRLLATLGVLAMQGRLPAPNSGGETPSSSGGGDADNAEEARRRALKYQLMGSL